MTSQPNYLNLRKVRFLAGDLWFERGEDYFEQGRVNRLTEKDGVLSAFVEGTKDYRVRLWREEDDEIGYSCTCPLGVNGQFCKHCVAAALAWNENARESKKISNPKRKSQGDDLKSFLEHQEKEKLIEVLLREASENRNLRKRLLLDAARVNPSGVDLKAFRKSITTAMRTGGFIDYKSAPRYARRIDQVVDSIAALLDDGHAREVVALTEFALGRLEKVFGEVDDSDGNMGDISTNLEELHLRACAAANEDPVILAKRLFEWEMKSEWDIFCGAATIYADVLGTKGLAEYRRLAEIKWKQMPALLPGAEKSQNYYERSNITSIMEALARQSGDHETLVEIKSRDLSQPYTFLEIAEIYRKAKQDDKALDWAEKGLRLFPNIYSGLSDFVTEGYHRRGHHSEAMDIVWTEFIKSPSLFSYQKLQANALRPSKIEREWTQWRDKALAHLRSFIESEKRATQTAKTVYSWERVIDHSPLVEIFLWEKRYDDAWQEATTGGCSDYLSLQVADAVASDHPERALPIYKASIAPLIDQTNNSAYDEAIKILRKLRKVMSLLDRETDFDDYLIALRVDYKRKRNFIKLLDRLRK